MWDGYKLKGYYTTSQLAHFFLDAIENQDVELVRKERIEYFNIPCSFDIESTSFIAGENAKGEKIKAGTMYVWQFGINGAVIMGRTWDEWFDVLHAVEEYLELNPKRRLIIYVHNLSFEFQWFCKYFDWDRVFALKKRKVVYALTDGFEFRCSYLLSGYSLEYLGKNMLHTYPVQKLTGDLDYYKLRHSKTPLTEEEIGYCINDVRVVMSYIQEKIEQDGDITKIPLTNTGYVRNFCREYCYTGEAKDEKTRNKNKMNYKAIMKSLQIQSIEEYKQLDRAFMGGFTHASCIHSRQVLTHVGSADFTSSYPFCMVCQYFPVSSATYVGEVTSDKLFSYYLSHFCCLFDIEFTNLQPKVTFENILSESRCIVIGKKIVNNGRIVSADVVRTTITELDFDMIKEFYTWDSIKVFNMRTYNRGYLPKNLIMAILNLYESKTKLKGVDGKEVEYMVSKNMTNASFGMMVTAIIRDEFIFDETWQTKNADVASQLASYNSTHERFLFYPWGVWVTAHARHNLYTAILEFGEDYVYSDTDSIKGINFENHQEYFDKYNKEVFNQLVAVCNHYNIPITKVMPKTVKGETKMLGVWDFEGYYEKFKTLGAKRYMFVKNGKLDFTISGVNKKHAIPYLLDQWNHDHDAVLMYFDNSFYIPEDYTGKLTITYIDNDSSYVLVDYLGNEYRTCELSSVHMEKQSFYLSVTGNYLRFLKGVRESYAE